MKKILHYMFLLFLVFSVSACHKVSLHKLKLNSNIAPASKINIAVLDHRSYILNGEKTPDFVGIIRGGYGNPFDFSTESGSALAAELSRSLVEELGASSMEITTSHLDSTSTVLSRFKSGSYTGEKLVVLELDEWKIDSMVDSWFSVDSSLSIYDTKGSILAKSSVKERVAVDGSFWWPLGAAQKNMISQTEKYLNVLLSDQSIRASLK